MVRDGVDTRPIRGPHSNGLRTGRKGGSEKGSEGRTRDPPVSPGSRQRETDHHPDP